MKKYSLSIEGMHCASCAGNVEKSLKKVKGINNVSISLLMKKGTVEAEENVSLEQIKQAVEKPGYKLSSIK
jgi:P-type Cu+ transporter